MSREMKDSGIEWIGEIPKDWKIKRIRHCCELKTGTTPSTSQEEYFDGIVNWFTPSDFNSNFLLEKSEKTLSELAVTNGGVTLYPNNSILLVCIGGTVGKIGYIDRESYSNQQITALMPTNIYYRYLLYYLVSATKYIKHNALYTTLPIINNAYLKNIPILVPSINEQTSISEYIDNKCTEIDNIITQTTLSIQEYKKYKQSLITEAVTKGLNPDVEMKDSGVEWNKHIPKHWEVVNGRRLFSQRKDKAFEGDKQLTASQKLGIVYQEDFMESQNQKVVLVEKDFSILKHVEPNDFVISMRSFQGGLEHSLLRGCISSAYVMLIPNDKVYAPYFRWLFKSVKYINALQSTSNLVRDGQAMRYSNFVQIPLFIFPKEEQQQMQIT